MPEAPTIEKMHSVLNDLEYRIDTYQDFVKNASEGLKRRADNNPEKDFAV